MSRVFVPGFGALPSFYRDALTPEWTIHDPPPFRRASSFEARLAGLRETLAQLEGPLTLAGHSMGAALAVTAALEQPERIERLLLVAPAGLPLTKPIAASVRDFLGQAARRAYPSRDLVRSLRDALGSPRATMRLARIVRSLDLGEQLQLVRRRGIPVDVVGCVGDTLTPVGHCRQIARLSGGRYREIDAAGGHMWMLVEPAAFAALLLD